MVAALIEQLNRPAGAVSTWEETLVAGRPMEAILLEPLDTDEIPTTWPENRFMEPQQHSAWADRSDITDSTAFVRALREQQWGVE